MAGSGLNQKIAARAYQLFLTRGGQHGRDQDDWLQAEREFNRVKNEKRPMGAEPRKNGSRGLLSREAR